MILFDLVVHALERFFGDGEPELDQERIEYLSGDAPLKVKELARQGREAEAIRAYRKITRSDKREAEAVVEWLVSNGRES
ncbi:MAG: hypothetical protein AAF368_09335 [Planctomycetota bacterium]